MKRILWLIFGIVLIALSVFCYGGWKLFGDELKAIRTLEMVDDHLYTFTYRGDYGFKAFLEQGGAKTDTEMALYIARFLSKGYMSLPEGEEVRSDAGCSTMQSHNLFTRSFDYDDLGQHIVVVRTYPDSAYASVSTSSFAFVGLGNDWHPVSGMDGMTALATIYIPFDGINEKGVCVADLIELDGDTTDYDSSRPDLTIVGAIRLVLDYAASVDEAIELLSHYDIHGSIGCHHHLSIADRGRSVVVEWAGLDMHVTETSLVTNHCLWESRSADITDESHRRWDRLSSLTPPTTHDESMGVLQAMSYDEWTLWSVFYDRNSLSGTWYIRHRWDTPFSQQIVPINLR